jgi:hypothetical protein
LNSPHRGDESVPIIDPMTQEQDALLKSLSLQAREPEAYAPMLTRHEAEKRIAALKAKLPLLGEPEHPA